jgi:hypothetical protein
MNLRSLAFLLSFFFFACFSTAAQDLTGIWKGNFITDDGETYKLEFQVKQDGSFAVTGVSYSYLDNVFYGKSTMKGKFSKLNKTFRIEELRTVEVKNLSGGTCLMNYLLSYSESGNEKFLEGTYLGKTENRRDPSKNGKWGDCGGGRVFLRRVESSDFQVEPFLRGPQQKPPVVKTNTQVNNPPVKKPTPPPVKKPTTTAQTKKPVTKPPVKTTQTTASGGVRKKTEIITNQQSNTNSDTKIVPKIIPAPVETRSRQNEMVKVFTVHNEEITIKLYDNGEIDNDTVSVYVDDRVVAANKRLGSAPIVLNVKLDMSSPEHTVVMVAENLGRIPPNTALMVILDGENRYQVNMTSTEQKNAMVRFRYQKN